MAKFLSKYLVKNADAVLEGMKTLNFKTTAIAIDAANFQDIPKHYEPDSTAVVRLETATTETLRYTTKSLKDQLVVFSELYYPQGWELTIDGKISPILNLNYVLRGAFVPSGSHKIVMTFNPSIIQTGTRIRWGSLLLFMLLLGGLIYRSKEKITIKKH